ncbi:MAG: FMN-binding protein [Bacteroidales bacterium]|nr:FMN-binding protein [Bacteroidales bacterium]
MKTTKKPFAGLMIALAILVTLPFTGCSQYKPTEKDLPIETLTELQTAFPKATYVELTETATYAVKDKSGKIIGCVLLSSPYSDDIKGFNGPTPLQIALDKEGKILEVRVLQNNETPNFLKRVVDAGFLNAWNGLTVKEALDKEVDAVSGATYSSNGIQKSLKARLQAIER